MKHSDPRSQRTGVAFTVIVTPERVLGLSEEMQPTLRVIEQGICIALKLSEEILKDHWVAPSPSMIMKNCFLRC